MGSPHFLLMIAVVSFCSFLEIPSVMRQICKAVEE
jgi:hypothetical protein